jgi:hypothetical protein
MKIKNKCKAQAGKQKPKHITTPILLLNYVVKLLTITSKLVENNNFDAFKSLKNRCI